MLIATAILVGLILFLMLAGVARLKVKDGGDVILAFLHLAIMAFVAWRFYFHMLPTCWEG